MRRTRRSAAAWTRVEALLKLTGEGLVTDPRTVPRSDPAGVHVLVPELGPDLVACVAVRTDRAEVRCRTVRLTR